MARDGTIDGLKLLTTATTTSNFVVTATGVDLAAPHPGPFAPFNWANYVSVPQNTLVAQSFQVALPFNTVSVRIIAGDPANRGTHTVIELHRDSADTNGTYIGTMSVQDAQ